MPETIASATGKSISKPGGPYSPALIWNNMVFVSGLLATLPDGSRVTEDVREQSMVVLRNLKNILKSAGSGFDKVLSVCVYLSDIADPTAFNEVYEEFFEKSYPARTVAGVSLPGEFKVEVSALACREDL